VSDAGRRVKSRAPVAPNSVIPVSPAAKTGTHKVVGWAGAVARDNALAARYNARNIAASAGWCFQAAGSGPTAFFFT